MAVGNQTPIDTAHDWAALQFAIQQKLQRMSTVTLVRVVDCTNDGGIVPVGTLTVQPLVNLLSGDGVAFEHKPLHKVPYSRVQGGANAVIIDPKPGDIGVCVFCERDISAVKKTKDIANPGSFRFFDKADGVYLFTCLGAQAPTQYVVLNDDGITIKSLTGITLEAPLVKIKGELQQTDGDASFADNVDCQGTVTGQTDVIAGNISGKHHTHTSSTPGNPTSPPLP